MVICCDWRTTTNLEEDHGGDLLGRESLCLAEVLDLDHWGTGGVGDLEGPRLNVLLDGWVIEAATNKTPEEKRSEMLLCTLSDMMTAHLTSKTVFSGFMAAWFFAASPIRRSSAVKETNEGVVNEPCSLATAQWSQKIVQRILLDGEKTY